MIFSDEIEGVEGEYLGEVIGIKIPRRILRIGLFSLRIREGGKGEPPPPPPCVESWG
jgi:hypothetical protein